MEVMEAGDPASLLDAEVPGMAQTLAGILTAGLQGEIAPDFEAMSTLADVHWIRYQVLPEGQDQDDLEACLTWSAMLLTVAPHLVPEHVRAHLTAAGTPAGATSGAAAEATTRAMSLYKGYFERPGNIENLQAAVTLFREAVAATPTDHPDRPMMLSNLVAALQAWFERTGVLGDLDEALTVGREAVAATPTDDAHRPGYLSNLATALGIRFGRTGVLDDLDEAVTLGQEAVAATPTDHPDRPGYLSNLSNALRTRFERTGVLGDLNEAITTGQAALVAEMMSAEPGTYDPTDHPNWPMMLSNLGNALQARFGHTGVLGDLDEAITIGRDAVAATPTDHPHRPRRLSNLGFALRLRFERTGVLGDLDEAIALFRDAVAATPTNHPDRPKMLSNLATALRIRFERTGVLGDLDEAITIGRDAATPTNHPDRPGYLSNLATALGIRFGRTGVLGDLDEAVTLGQEAVAATPLGHPNRPGYLSNLGTALRARFGRTGQLADLDQAISTGREVVDATPLDHPNRPGYLSNLGTALWTRFGRTGQLADLNQAISTGREAVDATPLDHPNRPGYLSSLGAALWTRFGRTGQLADLDQAISTGREVVDATPLDHPDRPGYLSNLGTALWSRFGRTGQLADLDQAISTGREAVDATPLDHPNRPGYLSSLGAALRIRFERTGQLADLDQAISTGREVVDATPLDHPNRPMYLSNLGTALQIRLERTGQQSDLDQAIATGREVVDATPLDHPNRPGYLSSLGTALWTRFGRTGQLADLDQAITRLSEAVDATPLDHPNRPRRLSSLGTALRIRFERTGQQTDLDQAIEVFREGVGVVTASPGWRLAAARGWGQCALLAENPGNAVEGYTTAIELLPLVAWHGLDQATREHHLREWAGLASEAAAAVVAAGDPARAVELLEAGRSMLWTQALHLRQDLAALQDRAPGLAAVLEASRTVLNTSTGPVGGPDLAGDIDRVRAAEQQVLDQRRQAARDWDDAVDQIRRLEGFEHFLRPVPFPALRPAATGGPVVIVNISRHGSHALIIPPATEPDPDPGVRVVDLPAAPVGTVIDQANTLLAACHRAGDPATDWPTREADRHAVFEVLAWTWQAITEPVLTALGHAHTPTGPVEDWPRVWWCPTGPATVLPLHAAGRHPRTGHEYAGKGEATVIADSVAGRVVSSYTPTLTALTRSRTRPAPERVRQLAVGVPQAPSYVPGAGPLPAVPDELQVIAGHLPPPDQATHLSGPAATHQAVLDALPRHAWLHLSCHGVQHPADASRSAFLLPDQPLTLANLADLNLREADLAYLAACQTATGDIRLLDEALHLAAALQLVGYRHVLATLWSISDTAAPAIAGIIYAHLRHPDPDHPDPTDRPEAARAAHALHHAVTRLRQTCPGEPLLWAPYIHLGP